MMKSSADKPDHLRSAAILSTSARRPWAIRVNVDALTSDFSATCVQVISLDARTSSRALKNPSESKIPLGIKFLYCNRLLSCNFTQRRYDERELQSGNSSLPRNSLVSNG